MDEIRLLKHFESVRRAVRGIGLLCLFLCIPLLFILLSPLSSSSTALWIAAIFFLGQLTGSLGLLLWRDWGRSLLVLVHTLQGLGALMIGVWPATVFSGLLIVVLLHRNVQLLLDHEGSVTSTVLSQRAREAIDLFD